MTKTTYTQKDIETVLASMAEESGESAYTVLGRLHEVGLLGFSSDPDKAARWYLEATKQCAREAMWRLSELKGGTYGTLVEGMKASHHMLEEYWLPTDEERAKLLKESAELGFQPAIKFLAEQKQKKRAQQENQAFDFRQMDLELEQEEKTLRDALLRGGAGAAVKLAEHLLLFANRLDKTNPGRDVQEEARGLLEPVLGHSVTANEMYAEHFAKNDREALELYSQALALSPDDAFQKARIELAMADWYMNEGSDCLDVQQGMQILERLIDAGECLPASAHAKLAKVYDLGPQTARNPVKAYEHYLASLDDGSGWGGEDPSIQFRLAIMTLHGNGCTADREAAKTWFRKIGHIRADRSSNLYKWARLALQLGWEDEGEWQECSMELYSLLVSANGSTHKEYEPRLSRPDVERLLSENNNCRIPYQMFLDDWDAQRGARRQKGSLKAAGEKWHGLLRDLEGVSGPDHIAEIYRMLDADRIALNDAAFSHLQGNIDQTALSSLLVARFLLDGRAAQSVPERALALLKQVDEYLRVMEEPSSAKVYPATFRRRLKDDVHALIPIGENLKAEREKAQLDIKIALAQEETHKQTLSFLTHTLNNALSTGPETVRTVIGILGSDLYDQGQAEYKAINNMASLFPVFLFAESLLKTFKLYVSDPEQIREKWQNDKSGDANVSLVIAMALRQSIARFVFSSNHLAQLKRLLPRQGKEAIKEVRKSFVDEIIPLEMSTATAGKVFEWTNAHFSILQVEIDPEAEMTFTSNATRYMFYFAAFSELVYNALKYADGQQPIEVRWFRQDGNYRFSCTNSCQPTSEGLPTQEGSNRGLSFIHKLMSMLENSELQCVCENGEYRAMLTFDHGNFN